LANRKSCALPDRESTCFGRFPPGLQSAFLVRRLASFDRETLAAAKAQVNRLGTPTATELQSSNDPFFPLLALPGAQARRAKVRNSGYGVQSDFELNFGQYLPSFGRADDDDTDKRPPGSRQTLPAARSKNVNRSVNWAAP
jgi:hypothetical protein